MAQARREFGPAARMHEETRSAWQFRWVEDLASDLRYAMRGIRRNPAFAVTAIACLALGIGVNTTIFSAANAVMFSRPTVRDAATLRYVKVGGISHLTMHDYRFLRDARIFEGLAGENEDQHANWRTGDATHRIFAVRVSDNYFDVTGTPLALGRGIAPGERDVAVVSWRFWQERLGGDPDILGRKLILDGRPHTVTGVLTRQHVTMFGSVMATDLYLPAGETIRLALYARLSLTAGPAETEGRLRAVAQELDRVAPLSDKRAARVRIAEIEGFGRLRSQPDFLPIVVFFGMLLVVVSLVLLIACANVASLLLARASSRAQELAIRLSIGAGRGRLVRQLLAETLLLGLCGAAAGLCVNLAATSWLSSIRLPLAIPLRLHIQPDWPLLVYATAIALASSLIAGLAPALHGARAGLAATLKRGERQTAGGWNLRNGLVAGQIAVSIVLLSAGLLFLRNLSLSSGMNPGFDIDHTVWVSMRVVPEQYDKPERVAALIDRGLERLRGTPGVEAASIARVVPLNDFMNAETTLSVDGGSPVRHEWNQNDISSDYFRTMQIPILAGRDFQRGDRSVVILNENFARALFGGANPIGHTIDSFPFGGKVEVIGVAANSSYFSLADRNALAVYRPYIPASAGGQGSTLHFLTRAAARPESILSGVREALDLVDPTSAIEVRPMNKALTMALLPSRAGALVLGSAGALGLILAAIGLYGVLLYTVSRRIREIGLRVALGASPGAVLALVLRHSLGLVGVGTAAGLTIAVFAVRPLAAYLVPGVRPGDPLNFVMVAGVLAAVALVATAAPALRALRIDPLTALRHD
jgi:predicted permease